MGYCYSSFRNLNVVFTWVFGYGGLEYGEVGFKVIGLDEIV